MKTNQGMETKMEIAQREEENKGTERKGKGRNDVVLDTGSGA